MEKFILENIEGDQVISEILLTVANLATQKEYTCDITTQTKDGEKCEIINIIVINIISGVLYDLIKYAISRYEKTKNYNKDGKVNFNGKRMTIEELKEYLKDK